MCLWMSGAGEIIANVVVEDGLSVVLDLSHCRKGEQTRFMTDFAERLYYKNRGSAIQVMLTGNGGFATH